MVSKKMPSYTPQKAGAPHKVGPQRPLAPAPRKPLPPRPPSHTERGTPDGK
jgi:hypothetical protein